MFDVTKKTLETLDIFLQDKTPSFGRRKWVYGDEGSIYIRVTNRMDITTQILSPSIDISSVEVSEPYQGQGVFKQLLEAVEKKALESNRFVFIESVLNSILLHSLTRHGYTKQGDDCPNFYKSHQALVEEYKNKDTSPTKIPLISQSLSRF